MKAAKIGIVAISDNSSHLHVLAHFRRIAFSPGGESSERALERTEPAGSLDLLVCLGRCRAYLGSALVDGFRGRVDKVCGFLGHLLDRRLDGFSDGLAYRLADSLANAVSDGILYQ